MEDCTLKSTKLVELWLLTDQTSRTLSIRIVSNKEICSSIEFRNLAELLIFKLVLDTYSNLSLCNKSIENFGPSTCFQKSYIFLNLKNNFEIQSKKIKLSQILKYEIIVFSTIVIFIKITYNRGFRKSYADMKLLLFILKMWLILMQFKASKI